MHDDTPQLPLFTIVREDLPPIVPIPNRRTKDLTGQKFGRLVVLGFVGQDKATNSLWLCQCVCGRYRTTAGYLMTYGSVKSCGCLQKDSKPGMTHGLSGTAEHRIWQHMIARCESPSDKRYANYGGRGIDVCRRWRHSFENFFADMGPRPSSKHSIDRIDNDLGYSPENCRWATAIEQANNKTTNITVEFNGKSLTLAQWEKETGIKQSILRDRLQRGWPIAEAFNKAPQAPRPSQRDKLICHNDERLTLTQWANKLGISFNTLRARQKMGWSVEKMLATPLRTYRYKHRR